MAPPRKTETPVADIDEQIKTIREDISRLTKLMMQLGEDKVSEAKKTVRDEADDLLKRSKHAAEEAAETAKAKVAPIEDYIVEKPVQSALIALLVGIFLGSLSRR